MTFRKFKRNKTKNVLVEPDEIFLDSKNIQNFNQQQFEGRLEKPIGKRTVTFLGIFFVLGALSFSVRLGYLQMEKGEAYFKRSESNILEKVIIFADRGIIYDRKHKELAWNDKKNEADFSMRSYMPGGFAHILGYVSYPARDKKGIYWQGEFIGKDGLEKEYDGFLKGENGAKIVETDAYGKVHSENIVNAPKRGEDLMISVDSRLQGELFSLIKRAALEHRFTGGAGVIMDSNSGEVLVATSYPEYDPEVLSYGKDASLIKSYFDDKRKIFMDRTISGLYTPGSIVKPIFALGALNEKIIDPGKQILSTGSISIPNPFRKGEESVFRDWKAHGWTDMREALAVSSDVYFYTIGGGYGGQSGLGIVNLEKYAKLFGIGEKTGIDLPDEKSGVIPSPEWKMKNFSGDIWRIGDTYNTSIGQYGFQLTPMEITRAIGAVANGGTLVSPHFLPGDSVKESATEELPISKENFLVVREGMRQAVTYGTASILNVPYVKIAAKTGTAQLGLAKDRVNSWVVGFFPYENPKYVFTVLMESGPSVGTVGASSIMRGLFDYMSLNGPEYFK